MTRQTGTGKYEQLLVRCSSLEPVPTAVVHPCEETALTGALEAGAHGLIVPILVGPEGKIREVAEHSGLKLGTTRIVDVPHSHGAEVPHSRAAVGPGASRPPFLEARQMSPFQRSLAIAALAAGLSAAPTAAQTGMPADSLAYARQLTTWFFAGEIDSVVAHLDSAAIDAEVVWQGRLDELTGRAGVETEVLEEKFAKRNGNTQYWRTSKFSQFTAEPIVFRWAFNKDGKIIGVGVSPQSQAPPIDPD